MDNYYYLIRFVWVIIILAIVGFVITILILRNNDDKTKDTKDEKEFVITNTSMFEDYNFNLQNNDLLLILQPLFFSYSEVPLSNEKQMLASLTSNFIENNIRSIIDILQKDDYFNILEINDYAIIYNEWLYRLIHLEVIGFDEIDIPPYIRELVSTRDSMVHKPFSGESFNITDDSVYYSHWGFYIKNFPLEDFTDIKSPRLNTKLIKLIFRAAGFGDPFIIESNYTPSLDKKVYSLGGVSVPTYYGDRLKLLKYITSYIYPVKSVLIIGNSDIELLSCYNSNKKLDIVQCLSNIKISYSGLYHENISVTVNGKAAERGENYNVSSSDEFHFDGLGSTPSSEISNYYPNLTLTNIISIANTIPIHLVNSGSNNYKIIPFSLSTNDYPISAAFQEFGTTEKTYFPLAITTGNYNYIIMEKSDSGTAMYIDKTLPNNVYLAKDYNFLNLPYNWEIDYFKWNKDNLMFVNDASIDSNLIQLLQQ